MSKTFIGTEPILYIQDGSNVNFYLDLTNKEYSFDDIERVTFIFTQDSKNYIYYTNENEEVNYSQDTNKVTCSLAFGSGETSSLILGKSIDFGILTQLKDGTYYKEDKLPKIIINKSTVQNPDSLYLDFIDNWS